MANINSFAENLNKIVVTTNNQLEILNGIQESITTDSNTVKVKTVSSDEETRYVEIPSWTSITNQVSAIKNSINSLLEGKGIVSIGDGTGRTVKLSTIASSPNKIEGLVNPTSFSIDANWWFEDLMYPSSYVTVDLLGKIDNDADRVMVNRVILDHSDTNALNLYNNTIFGSNISYENLIALLTNNGVSYTQDEEILNLPLSRVSYVGKFNIIDTVFKDGYRWYTLDSLEYQSIAEENTRFENNTIKLREGDQLSLKENLYTISEINDSTNEVRLSCTIGYNFPSTTDVLLFYNAPWQTKDVNIKFSNDEINIVYFKGINENFNIKGNEWSDPIMFVSNNLVYSGDNSTDYNSFYFNNIVDWGRDFIEEVKVRKISAARGIQPNAPIISANDFSVSQINTQINASIDSAEILQMKADIETTKSILTSKRAALASQQTNLQETTDSNEISKLRKQIAENIKEIEQLQTSYRTSLSTIQTILKENNGIDVKPKYHIRGFFDIPSPVYNGTIAQEVIGFQIAYRYIKEDSTGVDLKTYTYTDQNQAEHTGVYSDWTIVDTPVLEKAYSKDQGKFVWISGNISNANEVNINQVDIPITKGEKVEFMIRSVSEAGYPYCPLKSEWSNKVVIQFPSNLMTASDIENLIVDINDENVTINTENLLETLGLINHINDSRANVNSVNDTYFKHEAKNIAIDVEDDGTEKTISVQDAYENVLELINNAEANTSDLKSSVTSVKNDIKNLNTNVSERLSTLEGKLNNEVSERTSALSGLNTELTIRINEVNTNLSSRIDNVHTELSNSISNLDQTLSRNISEVDSRLQTLFTTQVNNVYSNVMTIISKISSTIYGSGLHSIYEFEEIGPSIDNGDGTATQTTIKKTIDVDNHNTRKITIKTDTISTTTSTSDEPQEEYYYILDKDTIYLLDVNDLSITHQYSYQNTDGESILIDGKRFNRTTNELS